MIGLRYALLLLEHLACGIPLIILIKCADGLSVWQRSIYRRMDRMTERVR